MKASEINTHCNEGKLLVAACAMLAQCDETGFDRSVFNGKEPDEILDILETVVDALEG